MSADKPDTPDGLDVQVAATEFDSDPVVADDEDDVTDIQFPNEVVFKRFARDIYESEEAGVREPVANAITAVARAEQLYDVADAQVEITIYHTEGGDKQLIIRDSGIGMTDDLIDDVLAVVGNSTSRDDGDVSGKFGMGFLACFMLVGFQDKASFIMHSRSRKTGEQVSGLWRVPGKFERKANLAGALDADEYGTKLIFPLKDDISVSDVRQWVRNHVEWARKPVVYREVEDGDEVENDEYGYKTFEDDYDENAPVVEIDNNYFRAVASPDARGRTILLDSPISGRARTYDLPWSVDIRFKDENGIIVDGPHEGLTPIKDDEYADLPDRATDDYIPESEEVADDIRLPEPTGTRDTLSSSRDFWRWLDDQLMELYAAEVRDRLEQFDNRHEFLDNLHEGDQSLVANAVFYENPDRVQTTAEEDFDYEISDDLAEEIGWLSQSPRLVDRGANLASLNSHNSETKAVWNIMQQVGDEGEVFMGVTMHSNASQNKAQVVWDDHEDNAVVKVDSTEAYDDYEQLGWRKLKEIRSTNIDEFDVSEDLKQRFKRSTGGGATTQNGAGSQTSNAGLDAPDRDLKVHYNTYGSPRKIAVEDIDDTFEEADADDTPWFTPYNDAHTLVLFPPDTDRNISDHQWLVGGGVAAANSTKMVYDYLNTWDRVYHVDDFIDDDHDVTLHTSHGDLTFSEARDHGYVVFHVVYDETAEFLREQDANPTTRGLFKRLQSELETGTSDPARSIRGDFDFAFDPDRDDIVYAPVTPETLDQLRADLHEYSNVVHFVNGSSGYSAPNVGETKLSREFGLYAHARFPEWVDYDEFDSLLDIGGRNNLSDRMVSMAETLGKLHDNGIDPLSTELTANHVPEPTIQTSEGELSVSKAEEQGDYLVFHVLPPETVDLFRDPDLMPRLVAYIKDESGGLGYGSGTDFEGADIVYAPVTNGEAQEVQQWLDGQFYYAYGDASQSGLSGDRNDVGADVRAYAYARLPEWHDTDVMHELRRADLDLEDEGWYFVETLAELHDAGVDPSAADDLLPT